MEIKLAKCLGVSFIVPGRGGVEQPRNLALVIFSFSICIISIEEGLFSFLGDFL